MAGEIRVGCGSWGDDAYVGLLYPRGLPAARRLNEYAKWFDHVEVNSTFYSTPRAAVVRGWVEQTPPGFLFDIKLHRHLLSWLAKGPPSSRPASKKGAKAAGKSSAKALTQDFLSHTLEQMEPLIAAKKLGAFLLLLSPHFRPGKHSLAELDLLTEKIKPHTLAVEFRNKEWVDGKNRAATLAYFRERGLAWVSVDMPRLEDPALMPPLDEVTQPALAYLRLHGRNKKYLEAESAAERHTYLYPPRELKEIVTRVQAMARQAAQVRVVANNHAQDFAPRTALALRKLFGQPVRIPPAS